MVPGKPSATDFPAVRAGVLLGFWGFVSVGPDARPCDLGLVRTTTEGTTSRGRPMGFLKRFFRNAYRDGAPVQIPSSFEHLSEEELEAHLGVMRYGDFVLSE